MKAPQITAMPSPGMLMWAHRKLDEQSPRKRIAMPLCTGPKAAPDYTFSGYI